MSIFAAPAHVRIWARNNGRAAAKRRLTSIKASPTTFLPTERKAIVTDMACTVRTDLSPIYGATSMRRRGFIALVGGAAAWPVMARAQQRMRRVGVLQGLPATDPEWQRRFAALRRGLQEHGWSEGRNVVFELRFADARPERLPALAAELVQANVDVIVTNAAQPVEAVRRATSTIPIVMATVGDALGAGYIASLARPGGNITGLTLMATDQSGKRLQLLKEISPNVARIAVLWNANATGHRLQMKEMESAAPILGISLQSLPIRDVDEIEAGLQSMLRSSADAVVTMDDPLITHPYARRLQISPSDIACP